MILQEKSKVFSILRTQALAIGWAWSYALGGCTDSSIPGGRGCRRLPMFLSLSFSPPLSLKINKAIFFKKKIHAFTGIICKHKDFEGLI